jgi:riboflavin kinase/FMN adenylyltransferase
MVEGPNFFFGCDRSGNIQMLEELCHDHQIQLKVVPPLMDGGQYISSSRVRDAVRRGDVESAARMLTHPYRIRGMVTHGARRGTNLGFPTANLDAIDTLIPGQGVYAGRAFVRGTAYLAAVNLGPNPTFHESAPKVEVHIIDFQDSIYGEPVEVQFARRLRDIRPFESLEQLKEQLARDVLATREL